MEFAISEVCMCAHMCASHCPAPARLQIGGSDVSAQEKPTGNTMLVRVLEVQSFESYEKMLAPEGVDRVRQFLPGFAGACFVTTFSACQPTHRSVACASPIGRPRLTDPASYPHRSVVCPSPIGQPSSHRSCFVPNPIDLPCLPLTDPCHRPVTDQSPFTPHGCRNCCGGCRDVSHEIHSRQVQEGRGGEWSRCPACRAIGGCHW